MAVKKSDLIKIILACPQVFLKAYNLAKRLKTLKGLTPYGKVIEGGKKNLNGLLLTLFSTLRDYTLGGSVSMMRYDYQWPLQKTLSVGS